MLVTKAKHNRIVGEFEKNIAILNNEIKILQKEISSEKYKLLEAKEDFEQNLKNKENQIEKLSAVNLANEKISLELKIAHGANGGLKASNNKKSKLIIELKNIIKEKDLKIKELEKDLKEVKSDKYRVVHCKSAKIPKMETSRVIRGPKNAQVNKMLKEIGDDHAK